MQTRRSREALSLCALLATLSVGFNVSASPLTDPQRLDARPLPTAVTAIVVTPRRAPSKRFDTARSSSVVSRKRIREQQADSSFDALRERPGVMVQQTNRGAGVPVIRGLVGPSNLVMIDGMRFNQATWRTGPSQYLTLLDPSSFQSFEVMRGPASVRYGSGAMGGVTTASPWRHRTAQGWGVRGGLRFVSQDTATSGWVRADGRFGPLSVGVGGAVRNHGALTTGGGETVPLSDWTQQAAHLNASLQLSERTTLLLGASVGHAGRVDRLAQGRMRIYDNLDGFGALTLRHRGEGKLKSLRASVVIHGSREEVARFDCDGKDALNQCVADVDQAYGAIRQNPSSTAYGATLARDRRFSDGVRTLGGFATAQWQLLPTLSLSVRSKFATA